MIDLRIVVESILLTVGYWLLFFGVALGIYVFVENIPNAVAFIKEWTGYIIVVIVIASVFIGGVVGTYRKRKWKAEVWKNKDGSGLM